MELLLDTGNVAKIRNAMEYYPVSGVTTNPTILRKEGDVPFWDLVGEIKDLIGPQRSLHIQTISSDADGIIREASIIAERLGMDTYIKIPVDREGLKAIKELASEGFRITATAIYTELQGVLAAMAGASYLAVYYNRMENTSIDADDVIKNLRTCTNDCGARILGASYRNVSQVLSSFHSGAHAVTVNPDIIDKALYSPLVSGAVENFRDDWYSVHGEDSSLLDTL